jgi:uncharacterized protein (TIGR02466 family)
MSKRPSKKAAAGGMPMAKMRRGAQTLFPTDIWVEHMPAQQRKILHEALLREVEFYRQTDAVGRQWSKKNYPAGYTSYASITDLPWRSPNFARLKTFIDRAVARYASHLDMDLQGGTLEMGTCWVNVMGKYSHHSFHLHPLSTISGTYYLTVPKGSGVFKIEDPRLGFFMASPPRKEPAQLRNHRFVNLEPSEGSLLLFESWVKHEVPANASSEERVSISFNYDWVRK